MREAFLLSRPMLHRYEAVEVLDEDHVPDAGAAVVVHGHASSLPALLAARIQSAPLTAMY